MIEELDAQQARGGLQDGSELNIRLARGWVAAGMVVGDDDCIRIDLECLAEDFAQLNCRRAGEVSERDKHGLADRAALRINRQDEETFPRSCKRNCRAEQRIGVIWRLDAHGSTVSFNRFHSLQTVAVPSPPTEVHSLQAVKSVAANDAAVRIETPDDAYPLFRAAVPLAGAQEGFFVLPIDAQRRPICKPVLVSLGHLPGTAAIELGEVFRTAFKVNADAIIVAHNHPSGDPTPSKADMQLTSVLQSTSRLLGIKFLDHLVLGSTDCEEGRGYVSVVDYLE